MSATPSGRLPRRRPATVVVVGSINMDLVVQVPRLPRPGETLAGSGFRMTPGGKGANQAVAVARLGGRAILAGRVGDDIFGDRLLKGLRAEGVDVRHVGVLRHTSSGVAVIAVEDSSQNSIAVISGANARLRPRDLRALEPVIRAADVLLLQMEIPLETVSEALRLARRHDVATILDCAPVPPEGLPENLHELDILTPNQTEAMQLTGLPCDDVDQGLAVCESLIQRHKAGVVVLKMGAQGALADAGTGDHVYVPAFPVTAVDATGAGDAFTAALALRLAEGERLGTALPFACAAGALAATRQGAQESMPTRAAVRRLLRLPATLPQG